MDSVNFAKKNSTFVHSTAVVDKKAKIGAGVKIWHFCHIRDGAILEKDVSLGRDVYIDQNVHVGRSSRIQNGVSVYTGVNIESHVFVGPHAIFTNDPYPRVNKTGWEVVETKLCIGSSIGAGAVILCGVEIGPFAMIAAGSIVTHDVPMFTMWMGVPARLKKKICACGSKQWAINFKMTQPFCSECKHKITPEMYKLAKDCFSKREFN